MYSTGTEISTSAGMSQHTRTDLHLSLLTDEEQVGTHGQFLKPRLFSYHEPDNVQEDELGVLIDLSLGQPDAKITILTDPENNANIVGFTEGPCTF